MPYTKKLWRKNIKVQQQQQKNAPPIGGIFDRKSMCNITRFQKKYSFTLNSSTVYFNF